LSFSSVCGGDAVDIIVVAGEIEDLRLFHPIEEGREPAHVRAERPIAHLIDRDAFTDDISEVIVEIDIGVALRFPRVDLICDLRGILGQVGNLAPVIDVAVRRLHERSGALLVLIVITRTDRRNGHRVADESDVVIRVNFEAGSMPQPIETRWAPMLPAIGSARRSDVRLVSHRGVISGKEAAEISGAVFEEGVHAVRSGAAVGDAAGRAGSQPGSSRAHRLVGPVAVVLLDGDRRAQAAAPPAGRQGKTKKDDGQTSHVKMHITAILR
jgi:hypothetical protein